MMVFVDFGILDTFNCIYGVSEERNGVIRVFVEGGLALPCAMLLSEESGVRIVKCKKGESESVESIFPRRYIYDPSRQVEYVEWELDDGLLRGRTQAGEWVQYASKADSQYAMHEFVGGCWFVFEGVHFSRRKISKYAAGREGFTGNEVVQEFGSRLDVGASTKEYFLEGRVEVLPGPGWMSWAIGATSFHIEI